MTSKSGFSGFPKGTVEFFRLLAKNNSKAWFEDHKPEFQEQVLEPARAFVAEMGARLKDIAPNVIADPRVDKSIFRIYRDTRFSKDKAPYKTHLGILFWEGDRPKMECPGFYFHIEPPNLMLGSGLYCFPKTLMGPYRDTVVDPKQGPELAKVVKKVAKKPGVAIGGVHYKRVPRGYDKDHPNADLLLHNGLYAWYEDEIPKELHSGKIVDYCHKRYKEMAPLHEWLVAWTRRIG